MDNKMVSITVTYCASDEAKKVLLLSGLPAQTNQSIVISIPIDVAEKLPIHVNSEGIGELSLKEQHYRIDSGYNYLCESYKGLACVCCGETNHDDYSVIKPIATYQDVINLITANKDREAKTNAILNNKKELSATITKLKNELTLKITSELETKYSNALNKIALIQLAINKKSRVRVAQIQAIING
jgi:hypothetical protein